MKLGMFIVAAAAVTGSASTAQSPAQEPIIRLPALPTLAAPPPDPNVDPNLDYAAMREAAEAYIRSRLVDPNSAEFEWPNGFMNGYWKPVLQKRVFGQVTCGFVNARNRFGGYVGRTAFVVVLNGTSVSYGQLGTTSQFDLIAAACAKSSFPAPQSGMFRTQPQSVAPQAGVADELQKLASLKQQGIITDEEFARQKAKLLGD